MYHFKSNDEIIIQDSREMKGGKKIYGVWFSDKRCDAIAENEGEENFHLFAGF